MGPCQGGFCIYRATGILHQGGKVDRAGANRDAARLPRGAVEGGSSHPARRPASAGAARRLDLSGHPRRGASAGMSYDTVVVGAGLAGLTAALRLTEQGQRVLVVARGVGATHLAPATVDVLGYLGDARVESPAASRSGAASRARPTIRTHTSLRRSACGLARVVQLAAPARSDTWAASTRTCCSRRRSAFPSRRHLRRARMSGGDLRAGGRFVFVGFKGFKDFHPDADRRQPRCTLVFPLPIAARALELAAAGRAVAAISAAV